MIHTGTKRRCSSFTIDAPEGFYFQFRSPAAIANVANSCLVPWVLFFWWVLKGVSHLRNVVFQLCQLGQNPRDEGTSVYT